MCTAIALPIHDLPLSFIEQHGLRDRMATRDPGAHREIQFHWRHPRPLLPYFHDNQLCMGQWGSRDRRSKLPHGGWIRLTELENVRELRPVEIAVPCLLGLERGIWFPVEEGIRAVLLANERRVPHVYVLTEPASHYFRVMTRSDWMPVMIGRRI